jgi:outer membrane protein TolC
MKKMILLPLSVSIMFAQSVSLDEMIQNAKAPKLIEQHLQEERLSQASKALASTQSAPLSLDHSLARNNGKGISGYEHGVGLSKEFILGDIQELERKRMGLESEAYLIEQQKTLIDVNNRLKNLYHQYCLDSDYLSTVQEAYDKFSLLSHKKRRAFEEGEISKTELLQIELESSRLQVELDKYGRQNSNEKRVLLSLTTLPKEATLSCQDTFPIQETIAGRNEKLSLDQEAYQKRIESTQVGLKRYNQKVESVEVSMGYTKELENDIYTIALSIPLNFTSNKSEYEKAAILHQSSALSLRHEEQMLQRMQQIGTLEQQLSSRYLTIRAQEQNIENYKSNLLTMMKKSYDYGESSVIEYLLSQQKLYTLEQELLKEKKDY